MQGAPRPPMLELPGQLGEHHDDAPSPLDIQFSLPYHCCVQETFDGACSPVSSQLGHLRLLAEAMRAGPRTWFRLLRDYGIGVIGWETLGEREASNQIQTKRIQVSRRSQI